MTSAGPTLVVGAGGLLGSSVVRARPGAIGPPEKIPWHAPNHALEELARWLAASTGDGPWQIAWCAGAGVVGTPEERLQGETRALTHFLAALERSGAPARCFALASSAGGIYGGSEEDPINEASTPNPISAYGEAKLAQEEVVERWANETGVRTVICRVSNLYGPGQDLNKPQGLVSRLIQASVSGEPLLVYVSLDTVRDYLYAPDAGRRVSAAISRALDDHSELVTTKIIASGRSATVGLIINELGRVRRRRSPVVLGVTALTSMQPRTLRYSSTVWPEIDELPQATLPEGLGAVLREQLLDSAASKAAR